MTKTELYERIDQSSYFDLVELLDKQHGVILQQTELIQKLVNEKAEQENFINEVLKTEFI